MELAVKDSSSEPTRNTSYLEAPAVNISMMSFWVASCGALLYSSTSMILNSDG